MKTWKFFLRCLWLLLLKVVSPSLPSRGGHDSFKQILLPLIVIESWEWTLPLATHGLTTADRSGSFCRSFFFLLSFRVVQVAWKSPMACPISVLFTHRRLNASQTEHHFRWAVKMVYLFEIIGLISWSKSTVWSDRRYLLDGNGVAVVNKPGL